MVEGVGPVDAAVSEVAASSAKRRRHTTWPGWKVQKQGPWPGHSLINIGGHLEWAQVSYGSTMWSFYNGQMYYLRVTKAMDPNGWQPWTADMADFVVSDGHAVPDPVMSEGFVVCG